MTMVIRSPLVPRSASRLLRSIALNAALTCGLLLAPDSPAFALNAALDVSQYAHTAWRIRDGFWNSALLAIAQTPDGYLWIGTETGLFRFDGVRSVPWRPPENQSLPSPEVMNLTVGRDGTLWIGTDQGLASWKDDRLTTYDGFNGDHIGYIVEARDGTIWVTVAKPTSTAWSLCSLRNARTSCYGADGGPGARVLGLFEDRHGTLWAGAPEGVWEWRPDGPRFYPTAPQPDAIQGFAENVDDGFVLGLTGAIGRLRDGRIEVAQALPASMQNTFARALLRDRDGGLWITTSSRGLMHMHQGVVDTFTQEDGLSGDTVVRVLEDREGSIWVATANGLDRFRETAAVSFSARQGLSNPRVQSVLAARDGSVWVGTSDGLNRVDGRGVTVYRESVPRLGAGQPSGSAQRREVTARGLPAGAVSSIFQDRRGRIWLSTLRGIGYLDGERFVPVNDLPAGLTRAIGEDARSVWVAYQDLGLYEVSQGAEVVRHWPWAALTMKPRATAMVGDPAGGVWLGSAAGGIVNVVDGQVRASFGTANGLAPGFVRDLHFDRTGALWVAAEGLSRVRNGRVATLSRSGGLPCDRVHWIVEDPEWFWLGTGCGLAQIARSELEAWAGAVDRNDPARPAIHARLFAIGDGVRLYADVINFTAPAVFAGDGRLWFMSQEGVGILDPRRLPSNRLAPPVYIEQITADRRVVGGIKNGGARLRLPPLTRSLQIDYTALSLAAPEKMLFRYQLEGWDRGWQEVGTRRQAFYENLPPGEYRFRVAASNNDGVWNETGAAIDFAIAPAYYQTTWFITLVVAAIGATIWGAHRLRLRLVETHEREIIALNERLMKAQEQERIRIAGELHDGVMQQMLAVTMMLGTAKRRVPQESEARGTLDKIQEKLIQVGTDIRQLSHDLHPPMLQEAGLPEAVRTYCEEFSAASGAAVSCEADDRARDLSRGAALALFRILQEALGNAAKHARAKQIAVSLRRSDDLITLVVSDDGVGFDRNQLTAAGGLGLITMRERAGQLNGKFEFDSAPGRGTTVRVVIPFR